MKTIPTKFRFLLQKGFESFSLEAAWPVTIHQIALVRGSLPAILLVHSADKADKTHPTETTHAYHQKSSTGSEVHPFQKNSLGDTKNSSLHQLEAVLEGCFHSRRKGDRRLRARAGAFPRNSLATRFFKLESHRIWFTRNRISKTCLKLFFHEIPKNHECPNRNKRSGFIARGERTCQDHPGPDRLGRILEGSVGCGSAGDRGLRLCSRQVFGRRFPQVSSIISVFSSLLSKSSLSEREGCFCFL